MHISTQVVSKPIFPWQSGGQQALRVRGGGGEQEDTRRSPGAQDRVLQFLYHVMHIRRKEVLTSTLLNVCPQRSSLMVIGPFGYNKYPGKPGDNKYD